MATRAQVALSSDAELTIGVAPAPVNYRQTLVEDLRDLWKLITFQPFQKIVTGGVIGTHQVNAAAELSAGPVSVSGEAHHSISPSNLALTAGLTAIGFAQYYTDTELDINVPLYDFEAPFELTYFPVSGNWWDIESAPLAGTTNQPTFGPVSGFVTFYAGYIDSQGITHTFPKGFSPILENLDLGEGIGGDTSLPLAPIQARILNGELQTINRANTPKVQLVANTDVLSLSRQGYDNLIYHVQFSNVIYAGTDQVLTNFAFAAPTDNTEISITDPGLARLPYNGP